MLCQSLFVAEFDRFMCFAAICARLGQKHGCWVRRFSCERKRTWLGCARRERTPNRRCEL